jgi:hypothetical protein
MPIGNLRTNDSMKPLGIRSRPVTRYRLFKLSAGASWVGFGTGIPSAKRTATEHFKEDIIQTSCDGIKHKPETAFGNVRTDVLAEKEPGFRARRLLQRDTRIGLA